ncbi:MAG: hypothetical protein IKV81_00590 [Clostridia bacterium]|nr:hypothetical protein [Clostridia bacterium]
MKKILSFYLVAVLMVCAFSACKSGNNQYLVDNYDDFYAQQQNSNNSSTDSTTSNDEHINIPTDTNSGGLTNSNNSVNSNSFVNSNNSVNSNSSANSNNSSNNSSYTPPTVPPIDYEELGSLKAKDLPKFEYGKGTTQTFKQDDRYISRATNTTADDYNKYLNDLIKKGFTKYSDNKIGSNLFTTLVNQVTIVTISFMQKDAVTTVIAEPKTYLYPRKQDNKYQSKEIQPVLTGINGVTTVVDYGLGLVIRLDDGSFIIIDGGLSDPNHVDSTKLLNILKEQSPSGTKKPVIAAWIFTHCHGDHMGLFNTFSIDYRDKVVIESFYCNFPTETGIKKTDDYMFDDTIYRYNQFKKAMTQYYPNVPKIRTYTGDKYYIRNAVIEILFSYENLFPSNFDNGDFEDLNAASLIFTVDVGGQSIMVTGDVENSGMKFAARNYGSYLKSDILQMSHHGWNSEVSFYSAVDPTYALLPVNFKSFEYLFTNTGYPGNQWLVNSPNLRQVIEFSKYTVSIPLPYNPSDDVIQKIPNTATKYPVYPTLKVEPVKPASSVPTAWFDLGFKNGQAYDKMGNLTVTKPGGTIGTTTVNYNSKSYNVTALTADSNGEGLLVKLPFTNQTQYKNWLMNGCTFELLVQVNKSPTGTSGFFTNVYAGGASLYYRVANGKNQLQFQLGTTSSSGVTNSSNNYASAATTNVAVGPVAIPEKQLVHCVGTYDKASNTLNLYYNGKHVSVGSYGNGEFKLGNASYDVLGIGLNPPYPSESFGKTGSLTVIGAKLYKTALTEAQVLKEYTDLIASIIK